MFEFFKKFLNLLGDDVFAVVSEFFSSSTVPRGCNSSFITLIPKVLDLKLVNDLISLIWCQYKIVGKILKKNGCLVLLMT